MSTLRKDISPRMILESEYIVSGITLRHKNGDRVCNMYDGKADEARRYTIKLNKYAEKMTG